MSLLMTEEEKLTTKWLFAVERVYAAVDTVTRASRTKVGLEEAIAELATALAELDRLADILDGSEVPAKQAFGDQPCHSRDCASHAGMPKWSEASSMSQ